MNRITMNGYTRISKREAEKRFVAGEPILICPCKMRPNDRFWGGSYITDLKHELDVYGMNDSEPVARETKGAIFINLCLLFTYYNCQYNETGKYPAFYKEVKEC